MRSRTPRRKLGYPHRRSPTPSRHTRPLGRANQDHTHRPGLLWRQRRCVIAHELAHAINGDEHSPMDDVASTKRERRADALAAGWLLQPHAVKTALAVAPDSLPAAAAELEVTERILSAWLWEHSKRGGLDS
ncbi:ImmA/IrrE family metallo-endopeptidase [Rothia mucilaginosa]|uniref:ImmA/IrrE family metallo-endopeptidase n=1 Tax=Rothia mucilaginosa TaxID=43675 RepID=UPI0034D3B0DC